MGPTFADLLQYIPTAGASGVLIFLVYCLISGKLVPGYLYEQLRRKNDDLYNAVLASTEAARLALETSKRRQADEAERAR